MGRISYKKVKDIIERRCFVCCGSGIVQIFPTRHQQKIKGIVVSNPNIIGLDTEGFVPCKNCKGKGTIT